MNDNVVDPKRVARAILTCTGSLLWFAAGWHFAGAWGLAAAWGSSWVFDTRGAQR